MVDNMKSTQKNTQDIKYISLLASKAHSNFLKNNNFLKNYILKDNKYFIKWRMIKYGKKIGA